jgi:hypothetical protein
MKKNCIVGLLVGVYGIAQATNISAPITSLGTQYVGGSYQHSMVYNDAYEWGINASSFSGVTDFSTINSVSITVNATLYNTTSGTLFISLLGSSPVTGLQTVTTPANTETGSDYWSANHGSASYVSLTGLPYGSANGNGNDSGASVTYTLNSAQLSSLQADLKSYSGFNVGFDPDCTYAMSSSYLSYTTAASKPNGSGRVPDATATAFLMVLSLLSVECCRRKFAFSK